MLFSELCKIMVNKVTSYVLGAGAIAPIAPPGSAHELQLRYCKPKWCSKQNDIPEKLQAIVPEKSVQIEIDK